MSLTNPEANADETLSDDTIAADAANTITISTNNTDKTTSALVQSSIFAASVTPSAGGAGPFQWQKQSPTSKRWVNMGASDNGMTFGTAQWRAKTGAMTASIAKSTWDGYKFRVKVTTNNGAQEVISDTSNI